VATCDNRNAYHDEGFHCADDDGVIVDQDYCDDDGGCGFFIWHSSGYRPEYLAETGPRAVIHAR
jgi:hypothetical protein